MYILICIMLYHFQCCALVPCWSLVMHIWFLARLEELLVESIRVVVSPCEVALLSLCACLCGFQPWYDFLICACISYAWRSVFVWFL